MSPYEQGRQAFRQGVVRCPFAKRPAMRRKWWRGYRDERREANRCHWAEIKRTGSPPAAVLQLRQGEPT